MQRNDPQLEVRSYQGQPLRAATPACQFFSAALPASSVRRSIQSTTTPARIQDVFKTVYHHTARIQGIFKNQSGTEWQREWMNVAADAATTGFIAAKRFNSSMPSFWSLSKNAATATTCHSAGCQTAASSLYDLIRVRADKTQRIYGKKIHLQFKTE